MCCEDQGEDCAPGAATRNSRASVDIVMTAHGTDRADARCMNVEVRDQLGSAERAIRSGDPTAARDAFLAAGDVAKKFQLWKSATRCYRHALELDLLDRVAVARLLGLLGRGGHVIEWVEYAKAIDRNDWPSFGCRQAQLVIGDVGAFVDCPGIGPVLDIAMPESELVEALPDGRFVGMPVAMAMIILRRALWPLRLEQTIPPRNVRVAFAGRVPVVLDELGEWHVT